MVVQSGPGTGECSLGRLEARTSSRTCSAIAFMQGGTGCLQSTRRLVRPESIDRSGMIKVLAL